MRNDQEAGAHPCWSKEAGAAWVEMQDRTDQQLAPLGAAVLELLPIQPGDSVLDVGCGCGQTLLALASLVGSSGRVLGIDLSEPMLARARQRVQALGLSQVELCRGDAGVQPFRQGEFDHLFSRFGVMFFDQPVAAFENLRRGLSPGGTLGFVCWQAIESNPWAHLPLDAVLSVLPRPEPPEFVNPAFPGPFSLASADEIARILSSAGFSELRIEPRTQSIQLGGAASLERAVEYAMAIGPAARVMAEQDRSLRAAFADALGRALAPFASERGVWMGAAVFVVTAKR